MLVMTRAKKLLLGAVKIVKTERVQLECRVFGGSWNQHMLRFLNSRTEKVEFVKKPV